MWLLFLNGGHTFSSMLPVCHFFTYKCQKSHVSQTTIIRVTQSEGRNQQSGVFTMNTLIPQFYSPVFSLLEFPLVFGTTVSRQFGVRGQERRQFPLGLIFLYTWVLSALSVTPAGIFTFCFYNVYICLHHKSSRCLWLSLGDHIWTQILEFSPLYFHVFYFQLIYRSSFYKL